MFVYLYKTFENTNKGMEKNRIDISSKLKKVLVKETGKSLQAVQMSLDYVFNSDSAKSIRKRAKELMQEEIDKIEI